MRRWVAASVVVAIGVTVARIFERWFPVRVAGDSMAPALAPGDLLAARPLRPHEPAPGQIVVARAPEREIIKRVTAPPRALAPGTVWLTGDNPAASTDSRQTGAVLREQLSGVVRARYWPPSRVRLFLDA